MIRFSLFRVSLPLRKTPLHVAAKEGLFEVVKILITKGVELEAKDHKKKTAIQLASKQGHVEVVNHLITKGAQLEVVDRYKQTQQCKLH